MFMNKFLMKDEIDFYLYKQYVIPSRNQKLL